MRYIQTKERIVYILEASPCLLLFSLGVYMLLKLQSNDRKLQSDEIFPIILFFFRNRNLRHFKSRCSAMNISYFLELLFSLFIFAFKWPTGRNCVRFTPETTLLWSAYSLVEGCNAPHGIHRHNWIASTLLASLWPHSRSVLLVVFEPRVVCILEYCTSILTPILSITVTAAALFFCIAKSSVVSYKILPPLSPTWGELW